MMIKFIKRFPSTITYIFGIVLINTLFLWIPLMRVGNFTMTPADFFTGSIFVMRDFSQREIKHYIIIAMLIGSGLSYFMASHTIALASFLAFVTSESIDYSIFTFTKKPLSERLIWSSMISSPADSFVFASVLGLSGLDVAIMTMAKFAGVLIIWYLWKYKRAKSYVV